MALGELLSELARTYDYEYRLSGSHVVVFRPGFATDATWPELPAADLRAWVRNLIELTAPFAGPGDTSLVALKTLREATGQLPAPLAAQLDRDGVPVAALQPHLRERVGATAVGRLAGPIAARWGRFNAELEALDRATIAQASRPSALRDREDVALELVFPAGLGLPSVPLWRQSHGPASPQLPARLPETPATGVPAGTATSVREAAGLISAGLKRRLEPPPDQGERRLFLILQPAHAPAARGALVDLYGWQPVRVVRDGVVTERLLRPTARRPRTVEEFRAGVIRVLPPDVIRHLTTPPVTVGSEKAVYLRDPIPVPGATGQVRGWLGRKLDYQTELARRSLIDSLGSGAAEGPIPAAALTPTQRRHVLRMLYARTARFTVDELFRVITGQLPDYVAEPEKSTLIRRGAAIGLRGPRGGMFLLAPGEPR